MIATINRAYAAPHPPAGTILIVTIWIILIISSMVLVFARTMRVSAYAAANMVATQQADLIADGALQSVLAQIALQEELTDKEKNALTEAVPVGEGYFWLLQSNLEDDRKHTFGLVHEASKINLNSASLEMLQKLPGMSAELAASIIDWRDEDSDLTEGGAESEYYLLQSNAYECKNAPLETVEEILLLRGATQEVLFGEDTNFNGVLDDHENDGEKSAPDDNRNGTLDSGLYDYVTVYSVEKNVDQEGNSRININDAQSRPALQQALQEALDEDRALEIMTLLPNNPSFDNIFEFYYQIGIEASEFGQFADRITTSQEESLIGLVNVNSAPKPVLLCLPSLEDSDADKLINERGRASTDLQSIAWVLEVLDQDKAMAIGRFITTRSYQYRADIVSVSGNGRSFRRHASILDAMESPTRVRFWKSLTHLGWPLDRDILATLRAGEELE
ncbi:MAG: general secretion pathway protein GspK [Planctomycetes bacterium]|nr:general secretion pathway protein GspK [Planctomycetota bacterium]